MVLPIQILTLAVVLQIVEEFFFLWKNIVGGVFGMRKLLQRANSHNVASLKFHEIFKI